MNLESTVKLAVMKIRLLLALAMAMPVALLSIAHGEDLLRAGPLDEFRPVEHWQGVAEVSAVADKGELQMAGVGKILVNAASKAVKAPYLMTKTEFGDVKVELEFMVPKGSNAGVYLMGRYEVQILDSFGKAKVGSGDLGGIYQRWDPTRPKGQQGFEGIAPKENAAKAPGEWQTMEIHFRAPRFDAGGKKTANAVFEKVLVNGKLVQENAQVTGPTRSSPMEGDAAKGPIAIQGDHGPIAIRAYRVTSLEP
jgi:Domain of Unknown Function (DUF1080)